MESKTVVKDATPKTEVLLFRIVIYVQSKPNSVKLQEMNRVQIDDIVKKMSRGSAHLVSCSSPP